MIYLIIQRASGLVFGITLLQSSKSLYYCFMDAGRRHELLDRRQKNILVIAQQVA